MNTIFENSQVQNSSESVKTFFRSVYTYMFAALGISGLIAFRVGNDPELFISYFISATGGFNPLFYVVMFAPIGLTFVIQWGYDKLSMLSLTLLFVLYSGLMGLMLSSIFLVYDIQSIANTFFVTAGAFGGMAILGYTTNTDLSKFGSLLYMIFIGMFIASIVNIFIGSDSMGFIIACLGVFVFTGLTAYHMQELKKLAQNAQLNDEQKNKMALIGGLTLYILFINLFLSLLRIMGGRD
ncbi:Bax inhibitor-1/YccA family protein [Crocinitomicaceae bacterium]|jgi:FtsH-binding integral membrane protein|nr:Bax inhibitor-1/YccA family protein [Crocinitomicaceae bacterium]